MIRLVFDGDIVVISLKLCFNYDHFKNLYLMFNLRYSLMEY